MIRALARFAGINPDCIRHVANLMVDEWGLLRLPGILLLLTISAAIGCALGYMGPGT